MNFVYQTSQPLRLLLVACMTLITISACTDLPVDPTTPESIDSAPEQELIELLGLDIATSGDIDLTAIALKIDLAALRTALSTQALEAPAGKKGRYIIVEEGESIQAALDAAPDGAIIRIKPGTYPEALLITRPVTLMGWPGQSEQVIIENPGDARNGITIRDTENVTLANFTVRDFDANGVFAVNLNGYVLMRIHAIDNEAYGLFPVRSDNGIMIFNTATGSDDAGLYVGQSENVLVRHNVAYGNVIGIEIENAVNIAVTHNQAYDNTAGMLAVLLPPSRFITFLEAYDLYVAHNKFTDNNLANFAEEGLAAVVPAGTGLLVVGYNETLVTHNHVTGNQFVGIGVGSTATFGALAGIPITDIEPNPDEVHVTHNIVTGNGTGESALPGFPPADLLWDLTGTGNCWEKNNYNTSFPSPLPDCQVVP